MVPHLNPMPGQVVGVPVPDPEREAVERREDAEGIQGYNRTKWPTRSLILIDCGVYGDENSFSYIHRWPEGLEEGARVVISDEGYGIKEVDGFIYFNPGNIIGWEPALDSA